MRIATFNLENLDDAPDGVRVAERTSVLRPQLERLEADILCLQEVNAQHHRGESARALDALDALLAGTRYQSFHRAVSAGLSGAGPADVHNLVTLSRWPILDHRDIRHTHVPALRYTPLNACPPPTAPIDVAFDRPVLAATIRLDDGRPLSVLNVHLRAPIASPIPGQKEAPFVWRSVSGWAEGFYLSALKRTAQALEVRMLVDALLDEDPARLVVAAGDFNAEDHETPLRILVGAEDDTGNGRLAERSLVVLDRSLPADRRFSVLHHGRPAMLDHMLASRALLGRFRLIEAHNETLIDEAVGFGKLRHAVASYHAPLVAEFA